MRTRTSSATFENKLGEAPTLAAPAPPGCRRHARAHLSSLTGADQRLARRVRALPALSPVRAADTTSGNASTLYGS